MAVERIGHPTSGGTVLPISSVVCAGEFVFASGQVPTAPDGTLVSGGIAEQTRQALENLREVLRLADCTMEDVVKVNVLLAHREDFPEFNRVYAEFFAAAPPARMPAEARPVIDASVEVDAIAYKRR